MKNNSKVAQELNTKTAEYKRRTELYAYSSFKLPAVTKDIVPEDGATVLEDYEEFFFFTEGTTKNSDKFMTNIPSNGAVPDDEDWKIEEVRMQILPTNRMNLWYHAELYHALAQSLVTFTFRTTDRIKILAHDMIVGNPPFTDFVSRNDNDSPTSLPDGLSAAAPAMRMSNIARSVGYRLKFPIVLQAKTRISVKMETCKPLLEHIAEWIEREADSIFHPDIAPENRSALLHDQTYIRIFFIGEKVVVDEKALQ